MLDLSNNMIETLPSAVSELSHLSVLNISGNTKISNLPAPMGRLSKLWNLNTRGCSLQEPLATMMTSKSYKTSDVIGYLRSILEHSKPYARLKLMVVGIQGIGKTSLLGKYCDFKVVSMFSILLQLAPGSRDLPRVEKRITVT